MLPPRDDLKLKLEEMKSLIDKQRSMQNELMQYRVEDDEVPPPNSDKRAYPSYTVAENPSNFY